MFCNFFDVGGAWQVVSALPNRGPFRFNTWPGGFPGFITTEDIIMKTTSTLGIIAGAIAGILLAVTGSVVAQQATSCDSTCIAPPNVVYAAPNANSANYANYATNAGSANYATNAQNAVNAYRCTGGSANCASGPGGPVPPPTPMYKGNYSATSTTVYGSCNGGPPPKNPSQSQAQQTYPSPAQVPADYIAGPKGAAHCCLLSQPLKWCTEPALMRTLQRYPLVSIQTL